MVSVIEKFHCIQSWCSEVVSELHLHYLDDGTLGGSDTSLPKQDETATSVLLCMHSHVDAHR